MSTNEQKENPLKLNAYYYSFAETGCFEIDLILSAVARAGKAYHHTESWGDDTPLYDERFVGKCPIDWIQNAANAAARSRLSGWVAVSERMPESAPNTRMENRTYVLVCDGKGRQAAAFHLLNHGFISGKAIGRVTHWQPLPEAP